MALRLQATRALGRVGDATAIDALLQLVRDDDARIRTVAARALGMTGATRTQQALRDQLAREGQIEVKRAILLALGQLGDQTSLAALRTALAEKQLAAAAAAALGRLAVQRHEFNDATRAALAQAADSDDTDVKHAVAFALAREPKPPEHAAVLTALRALTDDGDAEVAALAIRALASRATGFERMATGLTHADWRVRVESARGLADKRAAPEHWQALIASLPREWSPLVAARFISPHLHVIEAALRALEARAEDATVAQAVLKLQRDAAPMMQQPGRRSIGPAIAMGASRVHCLTSAMAVRAGRASIESLPTCGGDPERGMPMHERRALVAGLLATDVVADAEQRLTLWRQLAGDSDARVRVAAIARLSDLLDAPALADHAPQLFAALEQALDDTVVEVAGSAAAALATISERHDARADADKSGQRPQLIASARTRLLARAEQFQGNVELITTFLSVVAATRAPGAEALCEKAHSHANRGVRASARACLKQLRDTDPGPGRADAPPPTLPVAIDEVIGARLMWKVVTDKGDIRIKLRPDLAPWHVAAIVKLTRSGFYRQLSWHRVVADFVVQGGDPDGTGWGGPGFLLPAEPSIQPYVRGAVGIADAGLDTGGSQLFIMHSRAHHLDARYTLIGQVISGQEVVDALVVGDRIVSAHIIVEGKTQQ